MVTEVKTIKKNGVLRRYKTQYDGRNDLRKWKESNRRIREEAKDDSFAARANSFSRSRDLYIDRNPPIEDNVRIEQQANG